MSFVDQELLLDIFRPENVEAVRYHQDGVIIKGNAQDDKRNFVGSLMLIQRSIWNPKVPGSRIFYLIWIPYTYLFCLGPHLVSPAVRRLIDANGDLPLLDRSSTSQRLEWMYTVCLPMTRLAKIQRKSNLRGKRIINLFRVGGGSECPLIFQDGGLTKLFDEMKRVATVRPCYSNADDFIIEDKVPEEPAPSSSSASSNDVTTPVGTSDYVDPYDLRQELYGNKPGSSYHALASASASSGKGTASQQAAGASGTAATAAAAPSTTGNSKGSSVMNSLLSFGSALTQRGTKLAGNVMQSVVSSAALDQSTTDSGMVGRSASAAVDDSSANNSSAAFDLVQPIVDVDRIVPKLHFDGSFRLGPPLSAEDWLLAMNDDGAMDSVVWKQLREKAFYGGIDATIRNEVWAYLIGLYPIGSTSAERCSIDEANASEYNILKAQWSSIFPAQEKRFSAFRERKHAIEKDVIRTDRAHPLFLEDDSQHLSTLRHVLLSYAMYHFNLGYCQGMSDLVAVLTLMYEQEPKVFAMFRQLMSSKCEGNFISDVKLNMERQLSLLQQLIKNFVPELYHHLEKHGAEGMMFCFRWLLILFKREVDLQDLMLLWDVMFSCPFMGQYEIMIAAALLKALTPQIVQQSLTYDELLKFTNSVAGHVTAAELIALTREFYRFVHMQMQWSKNVGKNNSSSAGAAGGERTAAAASSASYPSMEEISAYLSSRSPSNSPRR